MGRDRETTKQLVRVAIEHLRDGEPDKALKVLEDCNLPSEAPDPDQYNIWDILNRQEAALSGAVA